MFRIRRRRFTPSTSASFLCAVVLGATLAVSSTGCAVGAATGADAPADARVDGNVLGEDTANPGSDAIVGEEAAADTGVGPVFGDDDGVPPEFDAADVGVVADAPAETTGTPDASTFTCTDTDYDVNGLTSDGCEVNDPLDIHAEATAHDFGSVSECDDTSGGVTLTSTFPSDLRTHEPSGRSGLLGLVDWFRMEHDEVWDCEDDPTYNVAFTGGSATYQVRFYKADGTEDSACSPVQVAGNAGTGDVLCSKQSDGDEVYLSIEKLSGAAENPSFTVNYHN